MFTGIVDKTVPVTAAEDHAGGRRLTLACGYDDLAHGESVAVNGCCLTVSDYDDQVAEFDVVAETLDKTNLGQLAVGDPVHVERSLKLDARIDGHFVQGHVDAQAEVTGKVDDGEQWRLRLKVPGDLAKFLIPKGSVTLDGTSLTIASLDGDEFEVALIPTTLDKTHLGRRAVGDRLNFEADMMTKTIVHRLEQMQTA